MSMKFDLLMVLIAICDSITPEGELQLGAWYS